MSHHPHPQPSGHQTHSKSKHASLSPHHPSVTNPNASAHSSASSSHSRHQPNIVGVHYRVEKKIGQGSFGIIYSGTNLLNNQQVAIKFEPRKADVPQLRDEYRAYRILAGLPGIPSAYYFGQEGLYNVLCIDLLGSSLEDLFDLCRRKFSVKTVALLAKQMITRVQSVHEKSLIYRDIKPDNFLMGKPHTKGANIVHLVDFGMVKQYRDPKTKQHIPYRERKSLSGTARYMSINTHLGREQSRRDDLEALGHVFMYFLRGSLPWQGLKAVDNKQKYQKISETKQLTSIKDLCHGFPEEFQTYMTYTRKLAFEETPNYDYLRGLMDSVLTKIGATGEIDSFDWLSPRGSSSNVQLNPDTSGNTNDLHSVEAATKMTLHGSRMLNKSLPTNNATNTNLTLPDPSRGNGETIGQYGTNLHNSDTHAHKDYSSPQYGMNQPNTSANNHQGGLNTNNGANGEAHNKNKPENAGFFSKVVDCITCRCSS